GRDEADRPRARENPALAGWAPPRPLRVPEGPSPQRRSGAPVSSCWVLRARPRAIRHRAWYDWMPCLSSPSLGPGRSTRLRHEAQPEQVELLLGRLGRGAREQLGPGRRLRERDHVSDVVATGE